MLDFAKSAGLSCFSIANVHAGLYGISSLLIEIVHLHR